MPRKWDIYLCYNDHDKEAVGQIEEALRHQGVRPYGLGEPQRPGRLRYSEAESAVRCCRMTAIFFGANGLSPWKDLNIRLLLTRAALEGMPLIPVLLPGAPREFSLPRFLTELTWIDFRHGLTEEALDSLARHIPGREKAPIPTTTNAGLPNGMSPVHRILFLGASPEGQQHLRLDHEVREIDIAIRRAEFRESFDLRQQLAVRPSDLQEAFLRYHPNIVHFSGHGKRDGILLEDETGHAHKVEGGVLVRIFREFKDEVRCVVLNSCYSQDQAEAIAEHIGCVIGMSSAVEDSSAIQFAAAFYRALAFGRSVAKAFNLACAQIDLAGLGDGHLPRLIALSQDPDTLIFAQPPSRSRW
ncbi:MAG: TIR domain-containing protein [Thermoanaerobaculia bacterium]